MERNFANPNELFAQAQTEIRNAAEAGKTADDIIAIAKDYVRECNEALAAVRAEYQAANQQLEAIRQAKEQSEKLAADASLEENDARIAAEMAQKMLDDAAMVHSIANKDTAEILTRAAIVLQDTVRTANAFYESKIRQREEYDIATVRLLATEKAMEYTAAKIYTDEGIKIQQAMLAEQLAEVQIAEEEIVKLQVEMAVLQQEKTAADAQVVARQLRNVLEEASERLAAYKAAEQEESEKTAAYIAEQEEQCETTVKNLNREKDNIAAKRDEKIAALGEAKDATLQAEEKSKNAIIEASQAALNIEIAIKEASESYEADVESLEASLGSLRDDIAAKKLIYLQAGEKWSSLVFRYEDLQKQLQTLEEKQAEAEAEENSTRQAAEVARRLADNAVRVRLSINSESADLLLQAQEVLTESAVAAEELQEKKHAQRLEIEKKCKDIKFNMEQAERDAAEAEKNSTDTKLKWEMAEERLAQEIERTEQTKAEYAAAYQQKVKEQEQILTAAEAKAAEAKEAAEAAHQMIKDIEDELESLTEQLAAMSIAVQETTATCEQLCREYSEQSEQRRSELLHNIKITEEEIASKQLQLDEIEQARRLREEKEAELATRLAASEQHALSLITAAISQLEAADAEIANRRLSEEVSCKAADEVAEYVGTMNISLMMDEGEILMEAESEAAAETEIVEEEPIVEQAPSVEQASVEEELPIVEEEASDAAAESREILPEEPVVEDVVAPQEAIDDAELSMEDNAWLDEILAPNFEEDVLPASESIDEALAESDEDNAEVSQEAELPLPEESLSEDAEETAAAAIEEDSEQEIATAEATEEIVYQEAEAEQLIEEQPIAEEQSVEEQPVEEQPVEEQPIEEATADDEIEPDLSGILSEEEQQPEEIIPATFVEEIPIVGYAENDDEYGVRITPAVVDQTEELPSEPQPLAPQKTEQPDKAAEQEAAIEESMDVAAEDNAETLADSKQEEPAKASVEEAQDDVEALEQFRVEAQIEPEIDVAEAARRAKEEAEEAEIIAGLTGGIPQIDKQKDENAEYTAWLDIISSDIIEKMMQNEEESNVVTSDVDSWLSNLEKTFSEEDTANRLAAGEQEKAEIVEEKATENEEIAEEETSGKKDKKKKKRPFRFF